MKKQENLEPIQYDQTSIKFNVCEMYRSILT